MSFQVPCKGKGQQHFRLLAFIGCSSDSNIGLGWVSSLLWCLSILSWMTSLTLRDVEVCIWSMICYISGWICYGSENFGLGILRDDYVGLAGATPQFYSLTQYRFDYRFVNELFVFYSFPLWRCDPTRLMASSFLRFLDHTQRRTTVGRTPLDEWSARRRDLYLTTHNTHNRQTSMPPGGIRTHDLIRRAPADLRLRPRGHWDLLFVFYRWFNL